ncbi:hypothetical protein [Microbacterium sp. A1-JK]|uniref:hypothetical protein n=1 Tax=Microbacterium sp. A1-JK TaxID=3177516 RepID=UPI00388A5291
MTSRSEREQLAKLDTTLDRLATAEKTALMDLNRAGFRFQSLAEARRFQERVRKNTRDRAGLINFMSRETRRTA